MNYELEVKDNSLDLVVTKEDIERALKKACLLVETKAKENCPVDTGALRQSITTEVKDNKGVVFTPLEYAPYVEFGTGLFAPDGRKDKWSYQRDDGEWVTTNGQKPQHFLIPALEQNEEKILEILSEELFK